VSAPCGRSMAVFDFVGTRCTLATRSAARLLHRASWLGHFHKTFGRSGHIKSHRSLQAVCVAPRAIAVKLLFPLHQIAPTAVFLDQPVNVIHASSPRPANGDWTFAASSSPHS
jgi:hypothetical protein